MCKSVHMWTIATFYVLILESSTHASIWYMLAFVGMVGSLENGV